MYWFQGLSNDHETLHCTVQFSCEGIPVEEKIRGEKSKGEKRRNRREKRRKRSEKREGE
jgi:hypothetical protein